MFGVVIIVGCGIIVGCLDCVCCCLDMFCGVVGILGCEILVGGGLNCFFVWCYCVELVE